MPRGLARSTVVTAMTPLRTVSILGRLLTIAALAVPPSALSASMITYSGSPAELVVSQVSQRTLRVQLYPRDAQERTVPSANSTELVAFPALEKYRARQLSRPKQLSIGGLRVELTSTPLTISIRRADGKLVQELVFDPGLNGGVQFHTDAPVFGLGEGARQFDRRGALYPMEPSWGGWNRPVLGSVVPSPFLIGTDGWAIFAHQPHGRFDLRGGVGKFLPPQDGKAAVPLDLFVIDAPTPGDALAEYVRLTGHAAMPPKWALGYFQSHRTLAGPEEAVAIAKEFRERQLPCDALIYLGTGYCPAGWNTGHGSLTFNPKTFADPAADLRALHELDFKVILHVNGAPTNLFGGSINEDSDSPSHIRNYWARHRDAFALGVDGWWPDDGDELPLEARLTRHRCYFEGALQDRPNVRPWSLHRTGYAGAQRYGGWIWSGDIDSSWATLAAQVQVGLNHSLSLTPFWGTDTGGFYPTKELTGELYARWFEFSAFCPLFRSHGRTWKLRLPWGWNTGDFGPIENGQGPDASELHNAAVEPICRKYLALRYQLLPYNYTLAREACDTGIPPMRALWLEFPSDSEATALGAEYLWGHDFLVAPVVEQGAKSRRLYLPVGSWYDWWTGEKLDGKRWIERTADLDTLPLYVRAGSVIPIDPVRQYTSQTVTEPTTLRVYPGADGKFTLYDDDGQSLGYRDGSDSKTIWIQGIWNDARKRLTLIPAPGASPRPIVSRRFNVELVGSNVRSKQLEFRGRRVETRL